MFWATPRLTKYILNPFSLSRGRKSSVKGLVQDKTSASIMKESNILVVKRGKTAKHGENASPLLLANMMEFGSRRLVRVLQKIFSK